MTKTVVAVPSCAPGGMEARMGEHFGHCDLYTLVEVEDGKVTKVEPFFTDAHEREGCLGPVNSLAERGVNALIADGMGMRPLMGFEQVGIRVYKNIGAVCVGEAVEAYLSGTMARFSPHHSCAAHQEGACH